MSYGCRTRSALRASPWPGSDGEISLVMGNSTFWRRIIPLVASLRSVTTRYEWLIGTVISRALFVSCKAMSSMDVLEDLLVIHHLILESGGPALLDNRLLIASLNRGGLAGSSWEMDDQ